MSTPFLSSEEYDERAHQLYNEAHYDEALDVLREGLSLYPNSVELHIGVGYARLAREEYAWARRSFEESLALEPEHEDALAGLGEVLLRLGQRDAAVAAFRHIVEPGYSDDLDLILQAGRALFREDCERMPLMEEARRFFDVAVRQAPEMAEPAACLAYARHRLGDDDGAIASLRRALTLDSQHAEARIYLANILFDRREFASALGHLEQTSPDDHWDEPGIWRVIELKKSLHGARDGDPDLKPWIDRLGELDDEIDDIDDMLAEIEAQAVDPAGGVGGDDAGLADAGRTRSGDGGRSGGRASSGQPALFGLFSALNDVDRGEATARRTSASRTQLSGVAAHSVLTREGEEYMGTWDEIVRGMRDSNRTFADRSIEEFMLIQARRAYSLTGIQITTSDAEGFLRGSALAGLLRIVR
ncbi:MAG: tetratricopeptide repeat protein [Gemmatimonadaceae bacterium]